MIMVGVIAVVSLMVLLPTIAMSNGTYSVGDSPAPGIFSLILLAVLVVAYVIFALSYFA